MPAVDLTGKVFNRLTVIRRSGTKRRYAVWECQCSCGAVTHVRSDHLFSRRTQSCGCYNYDKGKTHGMSRSRVSGKAHPIYNSWQQMLARCKHVSNPAYAYYGGRGITVCDRWSTFEVFKQDMEPTWFSGASIERVDNNEGYCPENCKWATVREQSVNKRSNILVEYKGRVQCLKYWCDELGLKYATVQGRIKRGWTPEEAFTVSVHKNLTE